jgi:Fe-S-cluster containining protein
MPGPFHRHADLPQTHKAPVHCSTCEAVCCRLKVVLEPGDTIPSHLTTYLPEGPRVMAHDEAGWCVAMDRAHMNCSIYENRPAVCRRFVMGGPYCKAVRVEYASRSSKTPLK